MLLGLHPARTYLGCIRHVSNERIVSMPGVTLTDGGIRDRPDLEITVDAPIGPGGDGYVAGERMSAEEAEAGHAAQIASLGGPDIATPRRARARRRARCRCRSRR